jgi:hypothetical protein
MPMIEKMDALGDLIDKLDRISKKRPHQLSHAKPEDLIEHEIGAHRARICLSACASSSVRSH